MTNVLILSLIYSPDNVSTAQIMAGIASELKGRDFNVRVLTTTPHYHRDASMEAAQPLRWSFWPLLKKSTLDGIEVCHIPMPSKSCPKVIRLLSWLWFVAMSVVVGTLMRFRSDAILVCTPPPFIGPCATLLSKIKGARLVYNVQELYPDIAINLGAMKNKHIIRFFEWMEQITYRRASYVTSITEAMCAKLRSRLDPSKVKLVPNFVEVPPSSDHSNIPAFDHSRFTVTYAGNMGVPQKLDLLVEAAKVLPEMKVWFIGDGRDKARLRELAKDMDNVVFTDYQPISEMPRIYAASDLFYVGQDAAACSDGIPSKIYRILGNHKPILAATSAHSDMAEFVRMSGGGVVVDDFSPATLAKAVRKLMSAPSTLLDMAERGRQYVVDNFSRGEIGALYADLLKH